MKATIEAQVKTIIENTQHRRALVTRNENNDRVHCRNENTFKLITEKYESLKTEPTINSSTALAVYNPKETNLSAIIKTKETAKDDCRKTNVIVERSDDVDVVIIDNDESTQVVFGSQKFY